MIFDVIKELFVGNDNDAVVTFLRKITFFKMYFFSNSHFKNVLFRNISNL